MYDKLTNNFSLPTPGELRIWQTGRQVSTGGEDRDQCSHSGIWKNSLDRQAFLHESTWKGLVILISSLLCYQTLACVSSDLHIHHRGESDLWADTAVAHEWPMESGVTRTGILLALVSQQPAHSTVDYNQTSKMIWTGNAAQCDVRYSGLDHQYRRKMWEI